MGPANQPVSKNSQQETSPEQVPSKHPKFLNAVVGSFKDDRNYLEVSQSIGNVSSYHQWEKALETIKKSIASHSLYLPVQCEYEQQGLCGTAGILKLKFDYFPFLLDEEIANRQFNSLPFEEKQLWFLLYILVQTAASVHSTGNCVGDIKPKNIFINESGDISVYSTFSMPEEFNNFQKVRYFKENNYLPPEGVNDIQTGKEIPSYDEKLGESFSIGLTILDAIFLTDHSFLYDQMQRFNEIAFKKIKENVKNLQINDKLKNVILLMLSMNPDKRLGCVDLYQYLAPYEKQIFELENFEIEGELKSKGVILSTQLPQIASIQQSPSKSDERASTIKTKRQNLVRYSIGKSDKTNKQQDSNEKVTQDSNLTKKIQVKPEKQGQNYSIEASISSSFKKIENENQILGKNLTSLHTNAFGNGELGNIRKSDPFQQEKIQATQTNKEKQEGQKEAQMSFKTGNLFIRQRSSASIIESPNRSRQLIPEYESKKIEIALPSKVYEHHTFQKTQFRQSLDLNSKATGASDHYSDFLRQIDKQIEDSKRLFPDSLK